MGFTGTLAGGCTLALAILIGSPETQAQGDSILEARQTLAWLETFDCPRAGFPIQVDGLQTEQERLVQKRTSLAYATETRSALQQAMAQRGQALREISMSGRQPSRRTQQAIDELDRNIDQRVAKAGIALTQWVLAEYISISQQPAGFTHTSDPHAHPLYGRESEIQAIEQAAMALDGLDGFDEFISPVPTTYKACLADIQSAVADADFDYIQGVLGSSATIPELNSILTKFEIIPWQQLGAQPSGLLQEVKLERDELQRIAQERDRAERERLERERRERADAERAEAERQREAERARLMAEAQQNLPTAQQFVSAMRNRSIGPIESSLANSVTMRSLDANGYPVNRSGKANVVRAFRDQFADQSSGPPNISNPAISSNGSISSTISSSRGSARMTLSFDGAKKITRIYIAR